MLSREELPQYTYQDYVAWEGRWELIEGFPYAMSPSPIFRHQKVSQNIAVALNEALTDCAPCQALLPVDWIVSDNTVVQPDNMVICYEPEGDFLSKAPSLIFEILSPSTAVKDRKTKFNIYQREGVSYYCVVDAENSLVDIYALDNGRYVKQAVDPGSKFLFELGLCRITLDLKRFWTGLD